MSLNTLFTTVITLALLLLAGVIAGRTRILDERASETLSAVTVKIGQPFLIINALISIERTPETVTKGLWILLMAFGILAFTAALSYCCAKGIKDADERKISEFAMMFTNCGFIGLPILESIFGSVGLFYGAFYVFAFNVLSWTWGLGILSRKRDDIRLTPKKVLLNFGTVPCLIGFLLFLSGIPLPESVLALTRYLASICTPFSMLITGANLARRDLRKMFSSPRVYWVNFVKLVVMPFVTAVLLRLLGLPGDMVVFGTVMTALPSAAVITMFGEMFHINPGFASELVGSTSLLSIATLYPVVAFAQWLASL